MDYEFLNCIRSFELNQVMPLLKPHASILEIGAGSGWQAKILNDHGFRVTAIDLPDSDYSTLRVWPVEDYDGRTLRFHNRTFDVVFCSHVMEHLDDPIPLIEEIKRVLKADGLFIAVLPTASWRLWTLLAYYPWCVRTGMKYLWGKIAGISAGSGKGREDGLIERAMSRHSLPGLLVEALLPLRHGAAGNAFSELYTFSDLHWNKLFERWGFRVLKRHSTGLFFTGYFMLGAQMDIKMRMRLSRLLGGSSAIYVTVPL